MRQFSDPHLAALFVMVVAVAGSVYATRRHPGTWEVQFARAVGLLIFVGWAGEYLADVILGTWSVRYTLPLQLTDAISVVAIAALWTRRPLLVELAYFWSLSATLQAVLTPDLSHTFPDVYYFTYFVYHVGPIVAAIFLVFGLRLWPRPGAVRRVYGLTLAWTAIAAGADIVTRGNYMYLRVKPEHGSLLDVLGPWPWYIVAGATVALAILLTISALTSAARRAIEPK